jgi:hypothetical protein
VRCASRSSLLLVLKPFYGKRLLLLLSDEVGLLANGGLLDCRLVFIAVAF